MFAESYAVKTLAPDHIDSVISMSVARGWSPPSTVIYDKAAASLAGYLHSKLKKYNVPRSSIRFNAVPVDDGNKELNTFLAEDSNNWRRLIVHPRCSMLRSEMVSYSRNPKTQKVIKDFDHGPDALRIGVWSISHGKPREVDVAGWEERELMGMEIDESGVAQFRDSGVTVAALV